MINPKVLVLIILALASVADAQRTTLTSNEYSKKKANVCVEISVPRRLTRRDDTYNRGTVTLDKLTVYDVESERRTRETYTSDGATPYRQIVITLDDTIYEKLGDTDWKKMPLYYRHGLSEYSDVTLGTDEYWIDHQLIDGQRFTVLGNSYEQKVNGAKGYAKEELFVAPDGTCPKSVRTYGQLSPTTVTRQVTTTIEHDAKIKIVAPIK